MDFINIKYFLFLQQPLSPQQREHATVGRLQRYLTCSRLKVPYRPQMMRDHG